MSSIHVAELSSVADMFQDHLASKSMDVEDTMHTFSGDISFVYILSFCKMGVMPTQDSQSPVCKPLGVPQESVFL